MEKVLKDPSPSRERAGVRGNDLCRFRQHYLNLQERCVENRLMQRNFFGGYCVTGIFVVANFVVRFRSADIFLISFVMR
jgi:hypothetical protein